MFKRRVITACVAALLIEALVPVGYVRASEEETWEAEAAYAEDLAAGAEISQDELQSDGSRGFLDEDFSDGADYALDEELWSDGYLNALGGEQSEGEVGPLPEAAVYEPEGFVANYGAGSGKTDYVVPVTFGQTAIRTMLQDVNDFRTNGKAWLWNKDDSTKEEGIVREALTYDYGLEKVAMQRAAEMVFLYSHTRPNNESCFSAYPSGMGAAGENIAIGTGTYSTNYIFELWKEEKEKYSKQGHRRNMLSESFRYIGIAHVKYRGCNYYVQEFSSVPFDTAYASANDSLTNMTVEVADSNMEKQAVSLSPSGAIKLKEGETKELPLLVQTLRLSGQWESAPDVMVGASAGSWSSSNDSVARIEGSTVAGVSPGSTDLNVSSGSWSGKVTCNVATAISSVKLSPATISLEETDSAYLEVVISPDSAPNKAVEWSSSNPAVASVNDNGLVTGLSVGSAKISVLTKSGGLSATANITVKEKVYPVEGVSLNKSELALYQGESETLVASVIPENATNKNVRWTSGNKKIATVTAGGLVSAKGAGSTTITVTTDDGKKTASCDVTVTGPVKVTGIAFSEKELDLLTGATYKLIPVFTPADATNQEFSMSSSKKGVVAVDEPGLIRAVSEGTAKITATSKDGKKKATITVKVTNEQLEGENFVIPVKGSVTLAAPEGFTVKKYKAVSIGGKSGGKVSISKKGVVKGTRKGPVRVSMVGTLQTINYDFIVEQPVLKKQTIRLRGAVDVFGAITGMEKLEPLELVSGNEEVLQVSGGSVVPVRSGKAKVTVVYEHGSISTTFTVAIPEIKQTAVVLKKNKSFTLGTLRRHKSINDLISYRSAKPEVIEVVDAAKGKIEAIGEPGEMAVVELLVDGEVYDSVEVTVK